MKPFFSRTIAAAAAAVALLLTRATADFKIVGPFALRITGKKDPTIDGYVWACHAGAATEGLCYAAGGDPIGGTTVHEFYYNYTVTDGAASPGSISYVFDYEGADGAAQNVSSFMRFYPNWASNVHLALLPPSVDDGTAISLDFDTGAFYIGSLFDDSRWNATAPAPGTPRNVSNFHICYQWTGGYWYRSLAWVSGFEGTVPQNPSCEPVNLGVESFSPA